MPVTIFHRETNANESWLEMNDDGSVTYHVENSGWPMMRGGVQARETRYTLDEAKANWSSYADDLEEAARKVKRI